jgi:hypothetical protein
MKRKTALKLLCAALVHNMVRAQESYTTTAWTETKHTIPEDYTVSFGSLKSLTFEHGGRRVKVTIEELMTALADEKK